MNIRKYKISIHSAEIAGLLDKIPKGMKNTHHRSCLEHVYEKAVMEEFLWNI